MDFFYHQLNLKYFGKCHLSLNHSNPLPYELLLDANVIVHLCSECCSMSCHSLTRTLIPIVKIMNGYSCKHGSLEGFCYSWKDKKWDNSDPCRQMFTIIYRDRKFTHNSVSCYFLTHYLDFSNVLYVLRINLYVLVLNIRKRHSNLNQW